MDNEPPLLDRTIVRFTPLILFLVCFFWYLSDMSSYGPTWDQLLFHMTTGRQYVDYVKTGNLAPILEDPNASWFPPVAPFIGHLFSKSILLSTVFENSWERYNVAAVVFAAVTVSIVHVITRRVVNNYWLALLAALLLAFHAQFVTHAHNNERDIGMVMFFALSILFLQQIPRSSYKVLWMIGSGVVIGLTFDTKQNGLFLLPIAFLWILRNFKGIGWRDCIAGGVGLCASFLISVYQFWPYLQVNTIEHLRLVWKFLTTPSIIAGSTTFFDEVYVSMHNIPPFYPWVMLSILTPPLTVLFSALGLARSFVSLVKQPSDLSLICLWICVPLARFLYPPSAIEYDQIRHFLEVLPALAVLAACGLQTISKFLPNQRALTSVVAAVAVGHSAWVVLTYRPYGTAYFNRLAGTSDYVNHAFDVEFWGSVYREAVPKLMSQFGPEARYFSGGLGAHILYTHGLPSGYTVDTFEHPFEYAIFMNKQVTIRNNEYLMWLLKHKKPLLTIEREGVVIFYAFKADKEEFLEAKRGK